MCTTFTLKLHFNASLKAFLWWRARERGRDGGDGGNERNKHTEPHYSTPSSLHEGVKLLQGLCQALVVGGGALLHFVSLIKHNCVFLLDITAGQCCFLLSDSVYCLAPFTTIMHPRIPLQYLHPTCI